MLLSVTDIYTIITYISNLCKTESDGTLFLWLFLDKPVPQSLLLLFPSKEVYSSHTYMTLPHPCWPLNPNVCHSRWWQSEMVLPTWGHSSDEHLSLPWCFLTSLSLFSSVAFAACCCVTHWPMAWLVTDSHQSIFFYFTMTATGLYMILICLKWS